MKRIGFLFPAMAWSILIIVASLVSAHNFNGIQVNVTHLDKFVHFIIYGVLSVLICWGWKKYQKVKFLKISTIASIFITSSSMGILMEVLQKEITSSRNFDMYDIIANIIGALIGSSIFIKRK